MTNPMMIRISIFVLAFLATVFSVISIAGNYWLGGNGIHSGLWRTCSNNVCRELPKPDSEFRLYYFYSGLYEQ